MKILKLSTLVVSYFVVVNSVNATSYLPPEPISFPEYTCIHQIAVPTYKKHQPTQYTIKTYEYAFISPDMTCPPFFSEYAIPANELDYVDEVIWENGDDIWDGMQPTHCADTKPAACAVFDKMATPNPSCPNPIACSTNVVDTDEDCRPGLLSTRE